MTVFSKLIRNSSSQSMASMSRWLVGSSRRRMSGFPKSACARSTLTFTAPGISDIMRSWSSEGTPSPFRREAASASAFQPSMSANSASSSLARMPSSSVKSSFA